MEEKDELIRKELSNLKNQMQQLLPSLKLSLTPLIETAFTKFREEAEKKMAKLQKRHVCPLEECTRRYSSKIAIRAHMRKAHGAKDL